MLVVRSDYGLKIAEIVLLINLGTGMTLRFLKRLAMQWELTFQEILVLPPNSLDLKKLRKKAGMTMSPLFITLPVLVMQR
jgi:hypothetical protein